MSTEQNKQLVRRLIEEGFNQGREAVIDELVSPKYRSQEEGMEAMGSEGLKELMRSFRTAFPDLHLQVEHILAEGDKVMTWAVFTGTHLGPLEAVPPTGKKVMVKDVDLWKLEGGKVVESWAHFDQPGLLQQLGVLAMAEEG